MGQSALSSVPTQAKPGLEWATRETKSSSIPRSPARSILIEKVEAITALRPLLRWAGSGVDFSESPPSRTKRGKGGATALGDIAIRMGQSALPSFPTQAKPGLEWATRKAVPTDSETKSSSLVHPHRSSLIENVETTTALPALLRRGGWCRLFGRSTLPHKPREGWGNRRWGESYRDGPVGLPVIPTQAKIGIEWATRGSLLEKNHFGGMPRLVTR